MAEIKRHVMCVGSANVDYIVELDTLPTGEGKQLGRGSRWGGGGLAATAAVAVAALGGRATWHGVMGDDPSGHLLASLLDEAAVEWSPESVITGGQTPVAAVLVARDGARWLGWPGAKTLDDVASRPVDLGDVHAVVSDTSAPRFSATVLLDARERGIPTVLDCEMLDADGSAELPRLAGHIVFSADGLARFAATADVDAALAIAAERLPQATVGVTLGAEGSAWMTADGPWRLGAPRVDALDTTGCGDVFHGAYALGLAEGLDLRAAATLATAAAALKAERGDGWSGMASRTSVDTLISKGWS